MDVGTAVSEMLPSVPALQTGVWLELHLVVCQVDSAVSDQKCIISILRRDVRGAGKAAAERADVASDELFDVNVVVHPPFVNM
eukprot:6929325-Heterocapsa_arctica.AAC.1